MITQKEYKRELEENKKFCEKYGIELSSQEVPQRSDTNDFKDAFHFLVTLNGESFFYSKGNDHFWVRPYELQRCKSLHGKNWKNYIEKNPIEPMAKEVIYSLLLDRVNGEYFDDWCANFGYDPDSRKAFKIYEACIESEKKLNKMFSREQIEQLEKELEDY